MLSKVKVAKVLPSDLLDTHIQKYIVAVIMAPLPDHEQTEQHALNVLATLQDGRCKAYWILTEQNRRCGVIAFITGPYSTREAEKEIKVLYVVGAAMPYSATSEAWHCLVNHGKDIARESGCRFIIFDVAPSSPMANTIISLSSEIGAQARFTIEV